MAILRNTVSLSLAGGLTVLACAGCSEAPPRKARKITPTTARRPATASAASSPAAGITALLPPLRLTNVDLSDAVGVIANAAKVSVWVNWTALEEAGVAKSAKVTLAVKDKTIEQALRLILQQADPAGRADLGVGLIDAAGVRYGQVYISTREDIARLQGRRPGR